MVPRAGRGCWLLHDLTAHLLIELSAHTTGRPCYQFPIWIVSLPVWSVSVERAFSKLWVMNRKEWACISEWNLEKYICVYCTSNATSDLVTSAICDVRWCDEHGHLFSHFMFLFLENKHDISYIYIVAAIGKMKAQQRFYGIGLNH